MKDIGKLISKYRKESGLTQEQLGKMLNVSAQAISKWENDLSQPDIKAIQQMSQIFNVSISTFFDEKGTETVKSTTGVIKSNQSFSSRTIAIIAGALAAIILVLSLCVFLIPRELTANQIYSSVNDSVFCIEAEGEGFKVGGTGFFIDSKGTAVTNYHVIKNCISGKAKLSSGKTYSIIKVLGSDEDRDIAIIKIDVKKSKSVKIGNSSSLKVGDTVYAIGYPQSFVLGSASSTFTQGIISKTDYFIEGYAFIQTTVDTTLGNSGGVLINSRAEVVGITTAKISVENEDYINLAIPINALSSVERKWDCTLEEYYKKHIYFSFISRGHVYLEKAAIYGECINPEPIQETGYKFEGWYTTDAFTELFDFTQPITTVLRCYAKWTPIHYTVTFDGSGASGEMESISATYGEPFTLPQVQFTKPHYVFVHWIVLGKNKTVQDGATTSNLGETEGEVVKLIAVWELESYKIHFDGNGDTSGQMHDIKVEYNQKINLPENAFKKDGYIFEGWQCGQDIYLDQQEIVNIGSAGDVLNFVAKWSPIHYTIVFDGGDASGEMAQIDATYDVEYTLPDVTFSYPHYSFVRWVQDDEEKYFTNNQTVKNLTKANADTVTLIAEWEVQKYTIHFDKNNADGKDLDDLELTYFQKVALPEHSYSKTGYLFGGWLCNGVTYNVGQEISELGGDNETLNFVAIWNPITYYIKFVANNNTDETSTQTVKYDQTVTLNRHPFNFVSEEKVFNSWQWDSPDGTKYFNDEAEISNLTAINEQTLTFVALWRDFYYIFKFDIKDGEGTIKDQIVTYHNLTYFPDTQPKKTGYEFIGWKYNDTKYYAGQRVEDICFGEAKAEPEVIVFEAEYKPNNYTIYYYTSVDLSGGSAKYIGLLGQQQATYDQPVILNNTYKITARYVIGWYLHEKQMSSYWHVYSYSTNQEYYNLTTSGIVNLVAQWIGVEFNVEYHNVYGEDSEQTTTETLKYDEDWSEDSLVNALQRKPTLHGYEFTGWTFNGKFYPKGTPIYFIKDFEAQEGETYHLYASWEPAEYFTVEFYSNGGEGVMESLIVYVNESFTLPECEFTYSGHSFAFWSIGEPYVEVENYQNYNRYSPGKKFEYPNAGGQTIKVYANWTAEE